MSDVDFYLVQTLFEACVGFLVQLKSGKGTLQKSAVNLEKGQFSFEFSSLIANRVLLLMQTS